MNEWASTNKFGVTRCATETILHLNCAALMHSTPSTDGKRMERRRTEKPREAETVQHARGQWRVSTWQCLLVAERKCGRQKETRLARQDVIRNASTSGVAGTSRMRCSAGLCRDTKPKSPQRHGGKNTAAATALKDGLTPQRRTRQEAQDPPSRKEPDWM